MAETDPAAPPQLRLHGLVKHYPGQPAPAVDQVNLSIRRGRMLALLGPSGCGKTTTLRMIAGLTAPTAGRIELCGRDITRTPAHRRGIGMVFQSYALFPHLDVAGNVAFGLRMRSVGAAERRRRVDAALELVRLGGLGGHRINQLSGGQQQRVALARALVIRPAVLLLDEPLSNLDPGLRDAMRTELRQLPRITGTTTIFVTHDQGEALSMADTVAVMSGGRIEQVGAPHEIYERPANRFVAEFIGRANLLAGTVRERHNGMARIEVPGVGTVPGRADRPVGTEAIILIRPHRIRLRPAEPEPAEQSPPPDTAAVTLHGTVVTTAYTGDRVSYTVQVGPHRISVEQFTGPRSPLPPGTRVTVTWSVADSQVLAG